jgi:hypothetical protein
MGCVCAVCNALNAERGQLILPRPVRRTQLPLWGIFLRA